MEPQTTSPKVFTNFTAPVKPSAPIPPPVASVPPPVPPPVAPAPPAPQGSDDHKRLKVLLTVLLAVLVVVGGYVWLKGMLSKPADDAAAEVSEPKENVVVEAYEEAGIAPEGFPADIPVEIARVTESYKTEYKEHNVEQYTLTYETDKIKDAKWDEYNTYMKTSGYSMASGSTNKSAGTLYGTKGNTGLLVTVNRENNKTVVRLNYFVKS